MCVTCTECLKLLVFTDLMPTYIVEDVSTNSFCYPDILSTLKTIAIEKRLTHDQADAWFGAMYSLCELLIFNGTDEDRNSAKFSINIFVSKHVSYRNLLGNTLKRLDLPPPPHTCVTRSRLRDVFW